MKNDLIANFNSGEALPVIFQIITKRRDLPISGKSLVKPDDFTNLQDTILETIRPGELEIVRLTEQTNLSGKVVERYLKVSLNEEVKAGQQIFEYTTLLGLLKTKISSPYSGIVEYFNHETGHLGIRTTGTKISNISYINGFVREVQDERSVKISGLGIYLQGIFGIGGEKFGILHNLQVSPEEEVTSTKLKSLQLNFENLILAGGSNFSLDALEFCETNKVKGIITGSITSKVLEDFLGYKLSISLTGNENKAYTLIITEGFGKFPLLDKIQKQLLLLEGKIVSINGTTQVRAGAQRPEIIFTLTQDEMLQYFHSNNLYCEKAKLFETFQDYETKFLATEEHSQKKLVLGAEIRIIRYPYFGQTAQITSLPEEPQQIPTEAFVRVVKARLKTGEEVILPRANIELV